MFIILIFLIQTGCSHFNNRNDLEKNNSTIESQVESKSQSSSQNSSNQSSSTDEKKNIKYRPDENYKKKFDESPLPLWMLHSLKERNIDIKIEDIDWTVPKYDPSRLTIHITGKFDITIAGTTIKNSEITLSQYDELNEYKINIENHSIWVDENYVLASVDKNIFIYTFTDDGLELKTTIDFSEYIDENYSIYPLYFQELDGIGNYLAVDIKSGKDRVGTIINILDDDFQQVCESAVSNYVSLERAYDSDLRSSFIIKPTNDKDAISLLENDNGEIVRYSDIIEAEADEHTKTDERIFIKLQDGKPILCYQMEYIFIDAYRSNAENNVVIYQKSNNPLDYIPKTQEEYIHFVSIENGSNFIGKFISEYDTNYNIDKLDIIINNFNYNRDHLFESPPLKDQEIFYNLKYNGKEINISYPDQYVHLNINLEQSKLSLWTEYDANFLYNSNNHIMDSSSDERYQIWEVRVIYYFESMSSSFALYDSLTNEIYDFGNLGETYYNIHFMDDDNVAIISSGTEYYYEGLGFKSQNSSSYIHKNSIKIFNLTTKEISDVDLDMGLIGESSYIYGYNYDKIKNQHVLLLSLRENKDQFEWTNEKEEYKDDDYNIAVFNDDGSLISLSHTNLSYFMKSMYNPSLTSFKIVGDKYWIYSLVTKGGESSYYFDSNDYSISQNVSQEFIIKMEQIYKIQKQYVKVDEDSQ